MLSLHVIRIPEANSFCDTLHYGYIRNCFQNLKCNNFHSTSSLGNLFLTTQWGILGFTLSFSTLAVCFFALSSRSAEKSRRLLGIQAHPLNLSAPKLLRLRRLRCPSQTPKIASNFWDKAMLHCALLSAGDLWRFGSVRLRLCDFGALSPQCLPRICPEQMGG